MLPFQGRLKAENEKTAMKNSQKHWLGTLSRGMLNPWTWVGVAALVRLTMLLGMGFIGDSAAIQTQVGESWPEKLSNPSGLVEFLQHRVYYRPLTEDEICYDEMARNLTAGRGFVLDRTWQITIPGQPAMYAGCCYPLFIAGVYLVFGAGSELPVYLIQITAHAAAAWLVFRTAQRFAGPTAGALAAAYYSFHPMLIWSGVAMMSEALVIPLVAVVFWLLAERDALGASAPGKVLRVVAVGGALAVLCLTRSTLAYFVPVVAVLLAYEARPRGTWWPSLAKPATCLLAFVVICAPWTARNYVHYGRLIPFSTKKGCNAYVFNHSGLTVEFGPGVVGGPQPENLYGPEFASLSSEVARDDRSMDLFLEFLREKPWTFVGLTWMRFWIAILPVAITAHSPLATLAAWYIKGPVLVLLPLGLYLGRRRLWVALLPWLLFVAHWQALQSISGPGMRHRLPADPVWACLLGVCASIVLASALRIYRKDTAPGEEHNSLRRAA